MGENLEEKVAELSVCCESCTNRLDKLETRVAQCVAWITERVRYDADTTAHTGRNPRGWIEKKVKAVFPD